MVTFSCFYFSSKVIFQTLFKICRDVVKQQSLRFAVAPSAFTPWDDLGRMGCSFKAVSFLVSRCLVFRFWSFHSLFRVSPCRLHWSSVDPSFSIFPSQYIKLISQSRTLLSVWFKVKVRCSLCLFSTVWLVVLATCTFSIYCSVGCHSHLLHHLSPSLSLIRWHRESPFSSDNPLRREMQKVQCPLLCTLSTPSSVVFIPDILVEDLTSKRNIRLSWRMSDAWHTWKTSFADWLAARKHPSAESTI